MDTGKTIDLSGAAVDTTANASRAQTPARILLHALLQSNVILLEEWQALEEERRQRLLDTTQADLLVAHLVDEALLTDFQAGRIMGGGISQLVFGSYRIMDRIGSGGMGVVYRGEHILMRRPVALKVLQMPPDQGEVLLKRFFAEMRVLARIQHPNIVVALDAGTQKGTEHDLQSWHYLVMEHVVGSNLEELVEKTPLSVSRACELIYQIASALQETHRHELIHRDIKPSNVLLTPEGVAKLLDFGLALHVGRRRLTNPGICLGTLSYMAPEQAADSANVDIRADIFALGATLFFALTGKQPFQASGPITHQIAARLTQVPPEVRTHRPDVPVDLQRVIQRMMARERDDRYPTPQSVMRALLPFVQAANQFGSASRKSDPFIDLSDAAPGPDIPPAAPRLLIVDDEGPVRNVCRTFFRPLGYVCHEARDGVEAFKLFAEGPYDLVLLDIDMPNMTGTEMLRRLRAEPPCDHLKVVMMSGRISADELSEMLALGADDYLSKPLGRQQLIARVKAALAFKASQDRAERLNQQLLGINSTMEKALAARHSSLVQSRNALVFALAEIVESRFAGTTVHLTRMTRYVKALFIAARRCSRLAPMLDEPFLKALMSGTLLHDIGNVAMPDHILRAQGNLSPEDLMILQAHTTIGADTLRSVAKRDRNAAAFWQMAIDIARHHHERFDGAGYPDGLARNDIPLAARIVSVADAYDSFRSIDLMSHNAAVQMLTEGSRGRFDPLLLQAFQEAHLEFERIYESAPKAEEPLRPTARFDSGRPKKA